MSESKSDALPLGESPTCVVVIEGIDPSSSAYETATHPSTSYHLGYPMRIELMIAESQPAVLPLNYGHHIETHFGYCTKQKLTNTGDLLKCVFIW